MSRSLSETLTGGLPDDHDTALLVGRVWRPDCAGPSVVVVRDGQVLDISAAAPTMRDLLETADPAALAGTAPGEALGPVASLLGNPAAAADDRRPVLLTPIDLQAIKAAGVTFVVSLLERVIEEQARGAPQRAAAVRADITAAIGADLSALKPGSVQAAAVKQVLIDRGLWSQYLEVGIGPDAEIFTKAQPLSAVGSGADIGIHPASVWNNPEPEIVLAVASSGRIVGATLGNDVNLRDVEGRSALLLGRAKDNNAACAIGPFLRLFDDRFTLDSVRQADVTLSIDGNDGFRLNDRMSMAAISRDPADLVAQTIGPHHQYPDGFVLFLGTLFAPVADRDAAGEGFTHHAGDIVTVASPSLGRLVNRVRSCADCPPWRFGAAALMRNLAGRGLLPVPG